MKTAALLMENLVNVTQVDKAQCLSLAGLMRGEVGARLD